MPCRGTKTAQSDYREVIDELDVISEKYSSSHDIILAGDFNAEVRGKNDCLSQILSDFIQRNSLVLPVNWPVGPTFFHPNGNSQIDYIFVSKCSIQRAKRPHSPDIPTNTSDHTPVCVDILCNIQVQTAVTTTAGGASQVPRKVLWHKVDKWEYRHEVNKQLRLHFQCDLSPQQIDSDIHLFMNILVNSADGLIPPLPPKKPGKLRLWNPDIAECSRISKDVHWKWKKDGSPVDKDNLLLKNKLLASKNLRREQRKECAIRRERDFNDITSAVQKNSVQVFRLLNKHKKDLNNQCSILQMGDRILQTPEQVREGWAEHFGNLATPAVKDRWDSQYYEHTCLEIESIQNICHFYQSAGLNVQELVISRVAVRESIKKLNTGKSSDCYGMTVEHLTYAGEVVITETTHLINAIFKQRKIPDSLKVGVVSPVYKKKDKTIPSNYRGITVTPVLLKLIEIILRDHMLPTLSALQHPLQRGFTSGVSALGAALILHETLLEYRSAKKPVYVAFLDVKAAFDTVSHPSMLRKLFHDGIDGDLWTLLSELYNNATSRVKWIDDYSSEFHISQGVRQGSITSTEIFKRYNHKLLEQLQDYNLCTNLGGIYTGTPTCADDISIIAETKGNLSTAVQLAENYSNMERFEFQATKSALMTFSARRVKQQEKEKEVYAYIAGEKIPTVETITHLGIQRDDKTFGVESTVKENIRKARNSLYHFMGAGLHGKNGLNPAVSYHIYKIYILPVLLYSMEIMLPKGGNLECLELFHRKTLKQLLSLPNNTPEPALYALLGAEPIKAMIHKRAMTFFRNVCEDKASAEAQIIDRQLAVKGFGSPSWISAVRGILATYQLPSAHDIIDVTPSKGCWKRRVYRAVDLYWEDTVKRTGRLYSSLSYIDFDSYTIGKPHPLLRDVQSSESDIRKLSIKLRLITGTYHLQTNRKAFNQFEVNTVCTLCQMDSDTREHFISTCAPFEDLRNELISKIQAEVHDFIDFNDIRLHITILVLNPWLLRKMLKEININRIESLSKEYLLTIHKRRQYLLARDASVT